MNMYLDGQLVQAEEIKFVQNKSNGFVYAIFPNGTSAPLQIINGHICVRSPYQNDITIMQISNR